MEEIRETMQAELKTAPPKREREKKTRKKWHKNNVEVFIMAMIGAGFLFVFSYLPMVGAVLAFKKGDGYLNMMDAIFASPWAGFDNFRDIFLDSRFVPIMLNTLGFNLLRLALTMPAPVVVAIMYNEVRHLRLKKGLQFFAYLPNFISIVVWVGLVHSLTDMQTGPLNNLFQAMGSDPINFKGDPKYSWGMIIVSDIIKGTGWGSIMYLAAIVGTNEELYDAASMLLWQTQSNLDKTEVINTFVLKEGINNMLYSYASAVGLFQSLVGLVLLVGSNWISKKINGSGVIF
jgi:putative aldouronate transport system permease protein